MINLMRSRSSARFLYGDQEKEYLRKRDKSLGRFMDRVGHLEIELNPDLFPALLEAMVWQQLSGKAAATIYGRLLARVETPTPARILDLGPESLRECGLSGRKVSSILEIATRIQEGKVDFSAVSSMTDTEVISFLTELPGVGAWTAEMLLIFSLGRPNILSWGDLGIRNGLIKLHRLKELTHDQFDRYAKKYSPYGTIASFYLWEAAAN